MKFIERTFTSVVILGGTAWILFYTDALFFSLEITLFVGLAIFELLGISLTLLSILYVSWFLSFVIKIRFLHGGILWVAYLIAVTKAADIGAYIVGTLAGRHSLVPHISPKKSVEGLYGGLLSSIGVSLLMRPYMPLEISFWHAFILGLLMGVVGQIGDLSESLMKRFCGAKDSGNLLPGMGGVLDSVDSILFTAPIFYFHLKVIL